MAKLMRARLSRLLRSKSLWAGVLFMFFTGICLTVSAYIEDSGSDIYLPSERLLFVFTALVPFALAVFSSLFIGTEHYNGGFKRKLSVGSKRVWVYLSNFISCALAGVALCLSYAVPYLICSAILFDGFILSIKAIALLTVTSFLNILAFTAVFVFISMMVNSRSASAVICLLLAIVLILVGFEINELVKSTIFGHYELDLVTNELVFIEDPGNYDLTDIELAVYDFLNNFLPGGQVAQLTEVNVRHPLILILWSAVIITFSTTGGLLVFKRKDIK